jgi:hypothetical protein
MALPGFLIEYLVTGACALFWIFGLCFLTRLQVPKIETAYIALVAPALYVLGILVDYCSRQPLKRLKKNLERCNFIERSHGRSESSATVWAGSVELGKQLEMRSSRDRIARGAVGNILLSTLVYTAVTSRTSGPLWSYVVLGVGLAVVWIAVGMWIRFERLTNEFKKDACDALRTLQMRQSQVSREKAKRR